jgi:hypothetical protein
MAFLDVPFRLTLGNGEPRFYPAHTPIKDRTDPGLCFELAQGQPWRWVGKGGTIEVELIDVLAAAALETLHGAQVLRGPILSVHALAVVTALRGGDVHLAECLERQQAAVLDSIDEWELGGLVEPPVSYRTIKNYKLNAPQRVPPPIQVVGNRQTVWLWGRAQARAWIATRPGLGWRSGLTDDEIQASGRRLPGRRRRPVNG